MVSVLWRRFLMYGWIGRMASIVVVLYASGWVLGKLGMDTAARQLSSAALFVLALLLTWWVIRWVWRNYTAPPRR